MLDPSQQQPNPRNSAGYRPLVPQELTKGLGNSPTAYVAAAVGLGLVLGVGIAVTAGHAAAPQVSDALSTHTSSLSAIPAVYAATTPSLLSQVDNQKKANAGTSSPLQASDKSARKSAGAPKKHRLHRLWNWKKGAHRKPYVSPTPVPEPDAPTGLELATAAPSIGG